MREREQKGDRSKVGRDLYLLFLIIKGKRWEDNIREWTGLEFGKSQRAVENREKCRKLLAKSSVVPHRP